MLDKTLGYILCCQSPGLFLAAAVLVIAYFAGRKKHRFKAVLKLLLAIVCAVGGIALYYLGMYDEYFTIRDFYQIRPAGWVGVGIAAFFTLLALVRAFFAAAEECADVELHRQPFSVFDCAVYNYIPFTAVCQ